jgi:hypothetical protein
MPEDWEDFLKSRTAVAKEWDRISNRYCHGIGSRRVREQRNLLPTAGPMVRDSGLREMEIDTVFAFCRETDAELGTEAISPSGK